MAKFKGIMQALEAKYVPTKKFGSNQRSHKPIWMNYKALKLVAKKRVIFAKYKDKNHPAVKAANIRASREIKHAKFSFEKNWLQR